METECQEQAVQPHSKRHLGLLIVQQRLHPLLGDPFGGIFHVSSALKSMGCAQSKRIGPTPVALGEHDSVLAEVELARPHTVVDLIIQLGPLSHQLLSNPLSLFHSNREVLDLVSDHIHYLSRELS